MKGSKAMGICICRGHSPYMANCHWAGKLQGQREKKEGHLHRTRHGCTVEQWTGLELEGLVRSKEGRRLGTDRSMQDW